MTRRITIYLFSAIVLVAACTRKPDEQRIRDAMTTMQQALETHDLHGFMTYVSSDFAGNIDTVDHDALANLLRIQVLRNDHVDVILGPVDIVLQSDRATAHVLATLTGGSGGLLPDHGAIYDITSNWRKDGSHWLCYSASWERKL